MIRLTKNILIAIACFLFIWAILSLHACSPRYTEPQARKLFGCKTDSIRKDSAPPVLTRVDTFFKEILIPGDSIVVNGPCEEVAKMKPGEKKVVKGKRTTSEYGKDSTGKSFFKCTADEYRDSMEWYREHWKTTVIETHFRSNPGIEPSWWQKTQSTANKALALWGLISLVIVGLMIWKKK